MKKLLLLGLIFTTPICFAGGYWIGRLGQAAKTGVGVEQAALNWAKASAQEGMSADYVVGQVKSVLGDKFSSDLESKIRDVMKGKVVRAPEPIKEPSKEPTKEPGKVPTMKDFDDTLLPLAKQLFKAPDKVKIQDLIAKLQALSMKLTDPIEKGAVDLWIDKLTGKL